MSDYSTSKYGDAVAALADRIILDGFAGETFGSVDEGGHFALVTIYAENAPETNDLYDEASAQHPLLDGSRVIVRTSSDGFVDVQYGPVHPLGDPLAYRALMGEWSTMLERNTGETNEEAERPMTLQTCSMVRYADSPTECMMARERSVAGISNDIPDCPVHGPHPDTASTLGRAVYVIHEGGNTPTYDMCDGCIGTTTDPDQTRADILSRDDTLHCVGCDWHAPECPADCTARIESWDDDVRRGYQP